MKGKKRILPALALAIFLATNLAAWWWIARIGSTGPDSGHLKATGGFTEEDLERLHAKELEGQFCTDADKAKVPAKEFMIMKYGSAKVGRPQAHGDRVPWGGFPVVALRGTQDLDDVLLVRTIRREAVKQAICSRAAPLIEVDPDVVSREDGLDIAQDHRVLLPLPLPKTPLPPLEAGIVEEGIAAISRSFPVAEMSPGHVVDFMNGVRASGHVPRGRLLIRMDTGETGLMEGATFQFIQPVVAP